MISDSISHDAWPPPMPSAAVAAAVWQIGYAPFAIQAGSVPLPAAPSPVLRVSMMSLETSSQPPAESPVLVQRNHAQCIHID